VLLHAEPVREKTNVVPESVTPQQVDAQPEELPKAKVEEAQKTPVAETSTKSAEATTKPAETQATASKSDHVQPEEYNRVMEARRKTNAYVISLGFDPATGKCVNKALAKQNGLDASEVSTITNSLQQLNLKSWRGDYLHDNYYTASQDIDAILFATADEVRQKIIKGASVKQFLAVRKAFIPCAEEGRGAKDYHLNYFDNPSAFKVGS
jgi:predicted DNA binding protein